MTSSTRVGLTATSSAAKPAPALTVTGTSGNDILAGGDSKDTISAQAGDDWLTGGGGNDTLRGGAGADIATFIGSYADYTVTFDAGTNTYTVVDSVAGRDGTDKVSGVEYLNFEGYTVAAGTKALGQEFNGSEASETINGGKGGDSLSGGKGDDRLVGGGDNDLLVDAGGNDIAVFSGPQADYVVSYDLFSNSFTVADTVAGRDGTDTLIGIGWLEFSDGTVANNSNNNFVTGSDGDDLLDTGGGDDKLTGLGGDDMLKGGAGTDWATYSGYYAEYVISFDAASGTYTVADTVEGRDGTDTLSDIEYLDFFGIDIVTATSVGGTLVVAGNNNGDVLIGGSGNDSLYGGKGNDSLTGGAGNDALNGYMGVNTAVFSGAFGDYIVSFDTLTSTYTITDKVAGRDGTDYAQAVNSLSFSDITLPIATSAGGKVLTGTDSADQLTGGSGNDSLIGGKGADTLSGAGGVDVLTGGAGQDKLDGGAGNDWLVGGTGNDRLFGRGGSDTAVFSGSFGEYTITVDSATGNTTVTDTVAGRDGVDVLNTVEFFQFADGSFAVDGTVALVGVAAVDTGDAGAF
ncbi:calcium-binding protein [Aquabacterium sp.]|uniref:calcium-binding protein n=1 Tax=Aquabacterium sp. TaxID=1872578 RepID=UPI002C3FE287|nr:calcium-binding protein [Aquabacterium sp.]HSW07168.1 calcium-binding protein [Aquabacterium sp.]